MASFHRTIRQMSLLSRCAKVTTRTATARTGCSHLHRAALCQTQTFRHYHDAGGSDDTAYRVDMRSDTLTVPSAEMRQAMADAEVGDDVYGEDPTVNELQRKVAELFGKESALFVPTGTMGNLMCVMGACMERSAEILTGDLSHIFLRRYTTIVNQNVCCCVFTGNFCHSTVMAHCYKRGLEALLGDKCHIHLYEQGGISQIGGVHPRTLKNHADGTFDVDQLRDLIRADDIHYPVTQLVCLENTHNYCGGKVLPLKFISQVRKIADEHRLGVHMDGARVMNAAVALGIPTSRVLRDVDTVSMCFSKGLGAPVGSIVAGTEEFMNKAHRIRKVLGGGMRQVGILAAAAIMGTEDAVNRLTQDHKHAKQLAHAFNDHGNGLVKVDLDGVHTNIVMVQVQRPDVSAAQLCRRLDTVTEEEALATKDRVVVSTLPFASKMVRVVTNSNISQEDIQLAIKKIKYVLEEVATTKQV